MMKGGKNKGKGYSQPQHQKQQIQYFDQEEQNFEALQIENHQDPEYHTLLKSTAPQTNARKNAYFLSHPKYTGTKQPQEKQVNAEPSEQQMNAQSSEEQMESSPQQVNHIASAIRDYRKQKKQESRLLTEDVLQIEKEDEEYQSLRKKQKTSVEALQEAVGLRNQLNLQKVLVDFRYNEQTTLQSLKKFPTQNFPNNQNLQSQQKQLQKSMFLNLNKLIETYGKYAQTVFHSSGLDTYQETYDQGNTQDSRLDVGALYKAFTEKASTVGESTKKELIKWSHKTSLINVSASHYSSLLMQTPVGQTQKIVSNWERAKSKCQHKRSTFKILFREEENARETSDPQIFDDYQLFAELEKGFISDVQDEQDFRISDTLKYLKNREARGQKGKEVDRKASKNRKLRFNVHAKLLNFMPAYNPSLIEARDQIVDNFFNCRAGAVQEERPQEGETVYIDM